MSNGFNRNGPRSMEQSQVGTLAIQGLPTRNPSTIYKATTTPMRLLVRNTGPTTLRVAYTTNALNGVQSDGVDHFQLTPGDEDVFILAPKQGLYAVSVGNGGQLSFAASDALPVVYPGGNP